MFEREQDADSNNDLTQNIYVGVREDKFSCYIGQSDDIGHQTRKREAEVHAEKGRLAKERWNKVKIAQKIAEFQMIRCSIL